VVLSVGAQRRLTNVEPFHLDGEWMLRAVADGQVDMPIGTTKFMALACRESALPETFQVQLFIAGLSSALRMDVTLL
jgi:hypothetical protein